MLAPSLSLTPFLPHFLSHALLTLLSLTPSFPALSHALLPLRPPPTRAGMPECKLGLNDKLVLDRSDGGGGKGGSAGTKKKPAGVELDDVQFHRCVQLGKFDADRTITYVPPDGEFELMK